MALFRFLARIFSGRKHSVPEGEAEGRSAQTTDPARAAQRPALSRAPLEPITIPAPLDAEATVPMALTPSPPPEARSVAASPMPLAPAPRAAAPAPSPPAVAAAASTAPRFAGPREKTPDHVIMERRAVPRDIPVPEVSETDTDTAWARFDSQI